MAAIIPSVNLVYYLQPSAGRMTGKPKVEMRAQLNVRVADDPGARVVAHKNVASTGSPP
jgi:hypothetical protein